MKPVPLGKRIVLREILNAQAAVLLAQTNAFAQVRNGFLQPALDSDGNGMSDLGEHLATMVFAPDFGSETTRQLTSRPQLAERYFRVKSIKPLSP